MVCGGEVSLVEEGKGGGQGLFCEIVRLCEGRGKRGKFSVMNKMDRRGRL